MGQRAVRELGVLFCAAAVARLAGMLYRILLARSVGAEALGLFQAALPMYLIVLTLASLGLPVAVTQSVSAALARGETGTAVLVRRRAAWLGGLTSCAGGAALLAAAPWIARVVLREPRAAGAIAILAWAIPPTVLAGIYRGYWQGLRRMGRVGAGQVMEGVSRCAALLVVLLLRPEGAEANPGGITPRNLGVRGGLALASVLLVLGEVADLAVVLVRRPPDPAGWRNARPPETRKLLGLALPVAFARTAASLGLAVDAALIPAGLALHAGVDGAAALFGELVGMALPVVFFPTVLLHPLETLVVPSVARAAALGDRSGMARRAGATALAAGTLAAATSVAMAATAPSLARGLYGLPNLAPLLRMCAAVPPGLFLSLTGTAVLNGLGRTATALQCQLGGTAVRVALLVWLVPRLGLAGAVAAIALGAAATAVAAWGSLLAHLARLRPASA